MTNPEQTLTGDVPVKWKSETSAPEPRMPETIDWSCFTAHIVYIQWEPSNRTAPCEGSFVMVDGNGLTGSAAKVPITWLKAWK